MLKCLKPAAALILLAAIPAAAEDKLGLGREATPEEVAAWDIDVRPDGLGLPEGSGDVMTGEELYTDKCAVCHGDFGEAVGRWPVLAGGRGTLNSARPVKTVGSYWPYLSTVWDYVHRAMPFGDAQSLTDDEVYAITAYILYLNDLVDDEFVLSRETFLDTRLPNEANFYMDDRLESPVFAKAEPCMTDCKPEPVKITMRAAVLDVTPDEEGGEAAAGEETAAEAETVEVAAAAPVAEAAPAVDPALVEAGEKVFRKCKACHQIGEGAKNRTGPLLNGVLGGPIGAVDGFRYSKTFEKLAADGAVWDDESLHAFLEKPKDWAKGTKMSFGGLGKAEDRDAVIAYIQATSSE